MEAPKVIIAISGKRKCGKDFVTDNIVKNLGDHKCAVVRLAVPVKQHFCWKYGMDLTELLSSSEYKEQIREEMIKYDKEQRDKDAGIFCRSITEEAAASEKIIWVVSDARRVYDVEYFRTYAAKVNARFYCVRIYADDCTRKQRNWRFTAGVDDVTSECGLDSYNNWDFMFSNSAGDDVLTNVEELCDLISGHIMND